FSLLVAKWLCHSNVRRSPSGSGLQYMRYIHQPFNRAGSPAPSASSSATVRKLSGTSSRVWPQSSRSMLLTGPSLRSRWSSFQGAAKPARRCRWTTRRRSHGALSPGAYGAHRPLGSQPFLGVDIGRFLAVWRAGGGRRYRLPPAVSSVVVQLDVAQASG